MGLPIKKAIFIPLKGRVRREQIVKEVLEEVCHGFYPEDAEVYKRLTLYISQYLPNNFCQEYADLLFQRGSLNRGPVIQEMLADSRHIRQNIITNMNEIIANTKLATNVKHQRKNQHGRVISY